MKKNAINSNVIRNAKLKRNQRWLTGVNCITRIITDLAVLEVKNQAFYLSERAPGVSVEEIQAKTAGELVVPEHVPEMQF